MVTAERFKLLRQALKDQECDGFIVPHADQHQNEYLPANAERLAWLTGFTGSAGNAVVLQDQAAIFVDGRYTLQAANQVDQDLIAVIPSAEVTPSQWLEQTVQQGQRIGFDPWLHTTDEFENYNAACEGNGAKLVACEPNPLDKVWQDQPTESQGPIVPHDIKYAGKSLTEKIEEIATVLEHKQIDAVVLAALDSVAWLLNFRASDMPYTPFALVFAVLNSDRTVILFASSAKVNDQLRHHLGPQVVIKPKTEFVNHLQQLANKKVQIDPSGTSAKVMQVLKDTGVDIVTGSDPCILPKACKNPVEIKGTINAHIRDGAALSNFLAWLDKTLKTQTITEIDAEKTLLEFRKKQPLLRDISFPTISSAGPNGAIIHYSPKESTNREIKAPMLYLVDSGGQYLDGTTDVTRVVAVGQVTSEQRQRFTEVLKGHIALASALFPEGTSGMQLDVLARQFLWRSGLDYAHGTGHGVGSYMCVHEGPQRIAQKGSPEPLRPGMIVSIEPGYYKTGEYGMRMENLAVVEEKPAIQSAEHKMLGFKTLTLAPINRELIDTTLLTDAELTWLNEYHTRVRETLMPLVDEDTKSWLGSATETIQSN